MVINEEQNLVVKWYYSCFYSGLYGSNDNAPFLQPLSHPIDDLVFSGIIDTSIPAETVANK